MNESIFELNDWVLCESQTKSSRGLYAKHLICVDKETSGIVVNSEFAWLKEESPVCYNCNEKVPDEIQALMHLHEWDHNA